MIVRAPSCVSVSTITLRFGSSLRTRKIWLPPMPSSGFRMASRCASTKASSGAAWRVTSVGTANCGNSATASFSEWSRSACGRLTTRAPSASARESSQVEVTYSMSKGGSLRITTASKSRSGTTWRSRSTNHSASSAESSRWTASAHTPCSDDQCSAGCSMTQTAWPASCAARIMATLESL